MNETPSSTSPDAPPAPRRRSRLLVALVALVVLLGAVIGVVLAVSPALRWSARAALAPSPDETAWRAVPGGQPIVAALDVKALLSSPVARAIRPDIERLARRQGFDLALAERNARLIVVASDGRGFVHGAAAGPRLSPLLLPRFDPRWHAVKDAGGPAVGDGSTVIRELSPGIVAFALAEGARDATPALVAGLERAATSPQEPLLLEGATLRILIVPDDVLRRRMLASVPRQGAAYAAAIQRLDARAAAGDTLDAVVRITMTTPDAATMTAGALEQLSQVLSTGLVAFLVPFLGEDAALLGKIPPFSVKQEDADVVVTISAGPSQLQALIWEVAPPED